MKSTSVRGILWPVVVSTAVVAILLWAVVFRRPASARSPSPLGDKPAAEGVVCFGTVDLEYGVTSLYSLQPGRIADVFVRENQAVPKGATLLRLEDAAPRRRLAEAEATLDLCRLQLQQSRKRPDQRRDQVARQKKVLEAMASRLAVARQTLSERQKHTVPGVVAVLDQSLNQVLIRELEALERVEAQRLAELEAQDVDADIRHAEYEVTVAEARRDQARLALDECRLTAPRAGTILRILAGPGDVLGGDRGQPAMLFAADGPQIIRATVEQEFASRINEGQPALIEDEGDSTNSQRGRVERIANWYSQRRTVLHDPSQLSDVRTLECVIVPEPGGPRMRLGQGVRVFIGHVPR